MKIGALSENPAMEGVGLREKKNKQQNYEVLMLWNTASMSLKVVLLYVVTAICYFVIAH